MHFLCTRKLSAKRRVHTPHVPSINNKTMTKTENKTHEPDWGERCFVKLDIVMSSIGKLASDIFQTKGTMTSGEAARYLGLSTDTLGRIVDKHSIPHWTPAKGKTLFSRTLIDEWVLRNSLDLSVQDLQENTNPLYY